MRKHGETSAAFCLGAARRRMQALGHGKSESLWVRGSTKDELYSSFAKLRKGERDTCNTTTLNTRSGLTLAAT